MKTAAVLSESEYWQFLHLRVSAVVDASLPYGPVGLVLLQTFHEMLAELVGRLFGEYVIESHADGVEFLHEQRVLACCAHGPEVEVQFILWQ